MTTTSTLLPQLAEAVTSGSTKTTTAALAAMIPPDMRLVPDYVVTGYFSLMATTAVLIVVVFIMTLSIRWKVDGLRRCGESLNFLLTLTVVRSYKHYQRTLRGNLGSFLLEAIAEVDRRTKNNPIFRLTEVVENLVEAGYYVKDTESTTADIHQIQKALSDEIASAVNTATIAEAYEDLRTFALKSLSRSSVEPTVAEVTRQLQFIHRSINENCCGDHGIRWEEWLTVRDECLKRLDEYATDIGQTTAAWKTIFSPTAEPAASVEAAPETEDGQGDPEPKPSEGGVPD